MDYQHYAHFFIIAAPILAFFLVCSPFSVYILRFFPLSLGPESAGAALSIPLAINWSSPSSWPIPLIPLLNDSLQQIVVCLKRTEDLLREIARPMSEEYSTQVRA